MNIISVSVHIEVKSDVVPLPYESLCYHCYQCSCISIYILVKVLIYIMFHIYLKDLDVLIKTQE